MTQTVETEEGREVFTHEGIHEPTARAIIAHLRKIAAKSTADLIEKDIFTYDQVEVEEEMGYREQRLVGAALLAHRLRAHPNVTLPFYLQYGSNDFYCSTKEEMVAVRRAIGGTWDKDWQGSTFKLTQKWNGLDLTISVGREAVCERVVVGTETFIETKPDPQLLEQVPLIEVTTEKEIVEWICPEGIA